MLAHWWLKVSWFFSSVQNVLLVCCYRITNYICGWALRKYVFCFLAYLDLWIYVVINFCNRMTTYLCTALYTNMWSLVLVCGKTGTKNTYWTPASIPFKVGVENSEENPCLYKHAKEGNCRVFVPISSIVPWLVQEIIDSIGTETRQIFCRMFVMVKFFEELFTP